MQNIFKKIKKKTQNLGEMYTMRWENKVRDRVVSLSRWAPGTHGAGPGEGGTALRGGRRSWGEEFGVRSRKWRGWEEERILGKTLMSEASVIKRQWAKNGQEDI